MQSSVEHEYHVGLTIGLIWAGYFRFNLLTEEAVLLYKNILELIKKITTWQNVC